MTRQSISMLLLAATVCAAPSFPGCSLVGLLVGTGIDESMADRDTLSPPQFSAVKQGDDIIVTLRNGTVCSGTYSNLDTLTTAEYAINYNACRLGNRGEVDLPMLGDSVTLYPAGEKGRLLPAIGGELIGFDNNVIVLSKQGKLVPFRISIFQTMRDSRGEVIDQDVVRGLMEEGNIALMTAMVVETSNGRERLPLENVQRVERSLTKYTKFILGGIGLAFDAIVVWLVAS